MKSLKQQAEKIKEDAVEEFKNKRKEAIKKPEEKAEILYNGKIDEGKKLAEKLKEEAALKINEAVEKTVKGIVG